MTLPILRWPTPLYLQSKRTRFSGPQASFERLAVAQHFERLLRACPHRAGCEELGPRGLCWKHHDCSRWGLVGPGGAWGLNATVKFCEHNAALCCTCVSLFCRSCRCTSAITNIVDSDQIVCDRHRVPLVILRFESGFLVNVSTTFRCDC